jgi:hypothetical protein
MKNQREFRVTMLEGASLLERLTTELHFLIYQQRLAWTAWKRDPIGFSRSTLLEGWLQLRRAAAPNAVASLAVAMLVILSAVMLLVLLDNRSKGNDLARLHDEETELIAILLPTPIALKEDQGVGAGTEGRVGFRNGKGEGSGPTTKKSTGGGSGGMGDKSPAQLLPASTLIRRYGKTCRRHSTAIRDHTHRRPRTDQANLEEWVRPPAPELARATGQVLDRVAMATSATIARDWVVADRAAVRETTLTIRIGSIQLRK